MNEKTEFIGEKAEIEYNNKKYEGTIIDETKNTITIKTKTKKITIIKKSSLIKISNKIIEGKKITKRPEDRIKAC